MNNDQIKQVFKKYVNSKNSRYALMLNASWGTGKTHFIKNEIFPIVKNVKKEPIYLSLNGISDINQLEHSLLILLYLKSQDKRSILKSVGKVALNIVNHIGLKKYEISLKSILDGANVDLLKLADKVVFFDDLERCKLPIAEILGHINDYVEHKNLKAIIIADEVKIRNSGNDLSQHEIIDDYSKIKEKVIGRSIDYKFDVSYSVSSIIKSYNYDNTLFKDFLEEKKDFIIERVKEFEITNLRTVIFFLENLQELFHTFSIYKELHDPIIISSLIFSNEFKEGKLKSENHGLKNRYTERVIQDFYQKQLFSKTEAPNKKSTTDINRKLLEEIRIANEETDALVKKYFQNILPNYKYFKSIHLYIYTGNLNQDLLSDEIGLIINNTPTKENKTLNDFILTSYYHYSDEDFKLMHNKVLTYAKEGRYDIYSYRQIYFYVKQLIQEKISPLCMLELENILLTGLSIAKEKIVSTRDLDISYPKIASDNDDIITKEILTIHGEYHSKLMTLIVEEIVVELRNGNIEPFETAIKQDDLISFINPKAFAEALTQLPNNQLYEFTEIFKKRYGFENVYKYHLNEIHSLKEIVVLFNKNMSDIQESMPIRAKLFGDLVNVVDTTVERINNPV